MKKILLVVMVGLLAATATVAQTFTPIHNYTAVDGMSMVRYFGIPYGPTPALNVTRNVPGALYFRTTDSTLYAYTGTQWVAAAGGGGGSTGCSLDSITVNGDRSQYVVWTSCGTKYFPTLLQYVRGEAPIVFTPAANAGDTGVISCPTCPKFGNGLTDGGIVSHDTLYRYNVTTATYVIGGIQYTAPQVLVTLAAADATFDRVDIITADTSGTIIVLTGTPAANPAWPNIDPSTQLTQPLSVITVKAGTTTPPGVTHLSVWDENLNTPTEWAPAPSAGYVPNFNNTTAGTVAHGAKSIDFPSYTVNRSVTFTGVATTDRNNWTLLTMNIKLKAPLAAASAVRVWFSNGTTNVTTALTLTTAHGFDKTSSAYQNISVPLSGLSFTSNTFNRVNFLVTGTGGGLYLDYVQLQGGIATGSSNFVEDIRRRPGTDTVEKRLNGIWSTAFLDSTGTGGGGSTLFTKFTWLVNDSLTAPVGLPRDSSKFLVGIPATGAFTGHDNQIATRDSVAAIYTYQSAAKGDRINNIANGVASQYTGTSWVRIGQPVIHQYGDDTLYGPIIIGSKSNNDVRFIQNGSVKGYFNHIYNGRFYLTDGLNIASDKTIEFPDAGNTIGQDGASYFKTSMSSGRYSWWKSPTVVEQVRWTESENSFLYPTSFGAIGNTNPSASVHLRANNKALLLNKGSGTLMQAIGGGVALGSITLPGTGATTSGLFFFTGGSGTGAAANFTVSGGAVTFVGLVSPGGGYKAGDVLSTAGVGGSGFTYTVSFVDIGGAVYFNTTDSTPYYHNGVVWKSFGSGGGGGGSYTASNGLSLSGSDLQLGGPLTAPTSIDLNSNQFSLVRGAYNALSFDPAHDTITIRHITGTGAESVVKLSDDNGYTGQVELRAVDPANGGYGSLNVSPGGMSFGGTSTGDQRLVNYGIGSGGITSLLQNTSTGSTSIIQQGIEPGDHPYVNLSADPGGGSGSTISVKDTAINITTPILRINGVLYGSGGGGGGNTIYTGDDALTGSRTVDLAGNSLRFSNIGNEYLLVDPANFTSSISSTDGTAAGSIVLKSDLASSRVSFDVSTTDGVNSIGINGDPIGNVITHTAGTHIFDGKVQLNTVASGASTDSVLTQDVSTGEVRRRSSSFLSSTFQQSLNNGNQITKNDTVDVNGFNFRFANGASPIVSMLSTGRTGFNKATPTEAVDVTGNILASGTITGGGLVTGGTASMSSAQAATELSDETGSASGGLAVYNNTPTVISPNIGDGTTSTMGINSAVSTNTSIMYLSPTAANATPLLYLRPSTGGTVAPAVVLNTSPTSATNSNSFSIGTGNATLPANTWNLASTLSGNASANSWPIGFLVSNTTSGRFTAMTIANTGNVGIALTAPLARLHMASGTTSANTAPLMLAGVAPALNTTPQKYAVEVDTATGGGNIYYSNALATRYTLAKTLTATSALNFASTAAGTNSDLTITVTGAADGDAVSLGVPNAAVNANSSFTAFVSATNTVTVRFNNYQAAGAIDPASATFRVSVIKY